MVNTIDYLYLILVPAAKAFRERYGDGKAPFKATRNCRQCRIEFIDKEQEMEWQEFCLKNELKNDASLEF